MEPTFQRRRYTAYPPTHAISPSAAMFIQQPPTRWMARSERKDTVQGTMLRKSPASAQDWVDDRTQVTAPPERRPRPTVPAERSNSPKYSMTTRRHRPMISWRLAANGCTCSI